VITSLAQCLLLYIREMPVSAAPPYMTGATYHTLLGHQRLVSDVTAAAAANAAILCPLGIDRYADLSFAETAHELIVVRIVDVVVRARASDESLEHQAKRMSGDERFRAMQSEVSRFAVVRGAPDRVHAATDDERAGIGNGAHDVGRPSQEHARLKRGITQPMRHAHIERRNRNRENGESLHDGDVAPREEVRARHRIRLRLDHLG
jgi:hypothetical protein